MTIPFKITAVLILLLGACCFATMSSILIELYKPAEDEQLRSATHLFWGIQGVTMVSFVPLTVAGVLHFWKFRHENGSIYADINFIGLIALTIALVAGLVHIMPVF